MLLAFYIFETLLNRGSRHNTVTQTQATVPKVHEKPKRFHPLSYLILQHQALCFILETNSIYAFQYTFETQALF
jgi:hypothetical protein